MAWTPAKLLVEAMASHNLIDNLWPHLVHQRQTKVKGIPHLQKLSFICLPFYFFPTSFFSSFFPGFPAHRGPDCQEVLCHPPLAKTTSTATAAAEARTRLEPSITCNSDQFFNLETWSHKKP